MFQLSRLIQYPIFGLQSLCFQLSSFNNYIPFLKYDIPPHSNSHKVRIIIFNSVPGGFIHSWGGKGYAKNEQHLHNKYFFPVLPFIQIRVQNKVLPFPVCISNFSTLFSQSSARLGYKYRVHKSSDVFLRPEVGHKEEGAWRGSRHICEEYTAEEEILKNCNLKITDAEQDGIHMAWSSFFG